MISLRIATIFLRSGRWYMSDSLDINSRENSRGDISDSCQHRFADFTQFFPLQPPPQDVAHIVTRLRELEAALLVAHRVLDQREREGHPHGTGNAAP
jgi:hypothetical protein